MIDAKETVIDGSTYIVTQLPARRALRMQAKLMKLLGPSAGEIIKAVENSGEPSFDFIPKAINKLVEQLDEKTFDLFVMELLEGVRKDGMELKAAIVDLEFAGKLNSLFLLLRFILEVNFGDFFQEGGILSNLFQRTSEIPQQSKND